MSYSENIKHALELIEQARKEIQASPTPLTKQTVRGILKLQTSVVQLRNTAVKLHRKQGWSLEETGAAFELSPSRVSQICNEKKKQKSRRILTKRPRKK